MNPFKENGYIKPVASINSMYIDDVLAYDTFRPAVLIDILEKNREILGISKGISGEQLLYVFHDVINSDIPSIKQKAMEIAIDFGDRLAKVITNLKKPSDLSMKKRDNWTDEHWKFWHNISKLYLVGGLTSPILTKIFYDRIELALKNKQIKDFDIVFIEGSKHLGTKGLSKVTENGEYLLFDFGQTNIKRRHFMKKNDLPIIDSILPSKKSDFLFYKYKNDDELKYIARLLDRYIINTILDTIKLTDFKGDKMLISIANYVFDGKIYSGRGGYAKLAYISDNYEKYLSLELSKSLDRDIELKLYHDTSAMALYFDKLDKAAVISLGTAFGVAFID